MPMSDGAQGHPSALAPYWIGRCGEATKWAASGFGLRERNPPRSQQAAMSVTTCNHDRMETLPGADDAGPYLRSTCLRDFGPALTDPVGQGFRIPVERDRVPVPRLLKAALVIAGFPAYGPGEKVEWWVTFTYRGHACTLAHQKFGVRLFVHTDDGEASASRLAEDVMRKLVAAVRTVERLVLDAAPVLLGRGDATVTNQHSTLRRAYDYFRARAEQPEVVSDVRTDYPTPPPGLNFASSFLSGKAVMAINSFNDLVAAITAYLSALEHALVLALPFRDFDPEREDLTKLIGARWGDKWVRLLGKEDEANDYRARLTEAVERWRNPYAHGGFEKGHGSTIFLHAPIAGAIPIGLTNVRTSPRFTLFPASESDIEGVFTLFDELDTWLSIQIPEAMEWITSALDVRFDLAFREDLDEAIRLGRFDRFLRYHEGQQEQADNMDY